MKLKCDNDISPICFESVPKLKKKLKFDSNQFIFKLKNQPKYNFDLFLFFFFSLFGCKYSLIGTWKKMFSTFCFHCCFSISAFMWMCFGDVEGDKGIVPNLLLQKSLCLK